MNTPTISFLICSHNEDEELQRVLNQLSSHIVSNKTADEIVILDDYSDNSKTIEILKDAVKHPFVTIFHRALNKNFGEHKTEGSRKCKSDWICQLDSDEVLSATLLENLRGTLEANPTVELYRVPRVNIVRGLTPEDARQWGWHVSTLPEFPGVQVINWGSGDYQSRIYKNVEHIKWNKPLHETVAGARVSTDFPKEVDWAIIHEKTISRQRSQNEFYNKNWSAQANMGNG